ncbi:MAG: hypothetical protein WC702_02635 [Patescibacteria group bacterium]|jgi:hypothetical protein
MSVLSRRKRPYNRVSKSLEKSLKDIYSHDGDLNMTKIDRHKRSRLTAFLIRLVGVLFLLALISWGGFLWWQSNPTSTSQPLRAEIETPQTITSGATSCFKVRYENAGRVPIAALSVSINLPETFTLKEAKPEATGENYQWTLSPLGVGSDGSVDLCGIFRSVTPGSEKIQAVFTYRAANFSSDFQDIAGTTVTIEKSILALEVTGATETVVGDQTIYTAKIKNNDTETTENLRLRAVLPESFTITSADPAVSEIGSAYWDFTTLQPGEEKTITFTGSFTSSASGILPITMEAGFLNAKKDFIEQAESKTETKVMGGDLAFNLIVNGSDKEQTVDLSSRLRLSLSYTNRGGETMEDVSFALTIESGGKTIPIDFQNSDLVGGSKTGNTITWNKTNTAGLALLSPSASGTVDPVLIAVSSLDPNTTADSITLLVKALVGKVNGTVTTRTISSTPLTIKFNSDAKLLTEARYFDRDGNSLGSGPLPPTVDEVTTYRIFWTIENKLHDLNNLSTTMNLPANVAWTNNVQADSGSITFNETTRQVTWTVSSLAKSAASTSTWFDLAITPSVSDIGSFINLTNPAAFEATDASTGDTVHDSTDTLTTALPFDELAEGKGVVE